MYSILKYVLKFKILIIKLRSKCIHFNEIHKKSRQKNTYVLKNSYVRYELCLKPFFLVYFFVKDIISYYIIFIVLKINIKFNGVKITKHL